MKNNQGSEHDHENETESEMRDEDLKSCEWWRIIFDDPIAMS